MSNKIFGIGIIGCGVIGQKRAKALGVGGRLVACADKDINRAKSTASTSNASAFEDWKVLLKVPEVEIVVIATLHDSLAQITLSAVEAGIHVLVEKPGARLAKELEPVFEAAKQREIKVRVGFNHRYHESVQDALKLIQSGELGRIINMRGVYGKSKLINFNQSDWRTKREIAGGGVLLDQGIHMVDLMRLFAGEFTEVQSFISNSHWGYEVEDKAYALMRTADGIVGMLNSSATQWRHRFNLDINLAGGSIILGGILTGTKSYGAETLTVVTVDHDNDTGDPREQLTRYNRDPSWEEEINRFADYVVTDQPVNGGSSLDALNTMKLVYKIYYADPVWRKTYAIANPEESKP